MSADLGKDATGAKPADGTTGRTCDLRPSVSTDASSAACASCGAAVNVPASAAWPERCPKCGAAPFSTSSGAPLGSGMGGGDSGSSAVPRPSSAATPSWESHWLIERPVEGETHPVYWSGKGWTPDPWQAKRFVTEAEATRAIHAYLHPFIPTVVEAKAVSHGFEVSRGS